MVVIDPISLAFGGLSMGMGLLQGAADNAARQQDYVNQVAFQNANSRFNRWQAGMNASMQNLNSQYAYWRDTVNHNQQLAYTSQLRGYEFAKEIAQAQRVAEARTGAGTQFIVSSAAIQQALQERGMQEAVALQQYNYRALQASAAYQASGQEGQTMDRFVANFARQAGDYETLMAVGQKFQERQYNREQLSAMTTYLNQYNSQQFYERTPYMDPIAPFPPLPTMVMPPPPSMTGAAPQSNGFLTAGTAILGGVNGYFGMASQIKSLKG
jgi:hypothetical protein